MQEWIQKRTKRLFLLQFDQVEDKEIMIQDHVVDLDGKYFARHHPNDPQNNFLSKFWIHNMEQLSNYLKDSNNS